MQAAHRLHPTAARWLGRTARALIRVVGSTLRLHVDDPHEALRQVTGRAVIFAFWHNRIFLMPYLFRRLVQPSRRGSSPPAVLVSASRDGARLVTVLEQFGIMCIRGSTSRGGATALREMIQWVQAGHDAAITPDGPRGPRYVVQEGVIQLAQLTGAPVLPVSWVASRCVQFNSWDGFMVPLPGTRCVVRFGQPMQVPPGEAARGAKRVELEQVLQALSTP